MEKFEYEKIRGLHLELTTKCNAMCPMCNRNFKGKLRENLNLRELSLEEIKYILPSSFLKQLKLISLCGVYGEPICNTNLKQILKYFYKSNPNIKIDIYTNGGLFEPEWWSDLATIMKDHNGTVIFGIDGVDETHELHRRNVDINKVMKNAEAYINSGGIAQWDYIVFKHNENQVKEAEKLSKKMGFKTFQIKKTSRFLKTFYEKDNKLDSTILEFGKHPVYDCNGKHIYNLELPMNDKYRNNKDKLFEEKIKEYGSIEKYFDDVEIICDAIKNGGIFISAFGELFPCCSVYQQVCYKTVHGVIDEDELNEYNLYKNDSLSLFEHSIKEIVEGAFFSNLVSSFKCKSIKGGKPKCCCRTCGKEIDYQSSCHTKKISYKE